MAIESIISRNSATVMFVFAILLLCYAGPCVRCNNFEVTAYCDLVHKHDPSVSLPRYGQVFAWIGSAIAPIQLPGKRLEKQGFKASQLTKRTRQTDGTAWTLVAIPRRNHTPPHSGFDAFDIDRLLLRESVMGLLLPYLV